MKHLQINLNVLIHKVKLQVRFPCSLLAILKIQNEEIAFGSEVPLRVGEAYLEISASSRFSIYFDPVRSLFSEKKILICIYLTTSSGRIPAGTAPIHTSMLKKGTNKASLNIQKCPDKNAYIEASISYQAINEIQFVQSSEHIPDLQIGQEPFTHRKKNSQRASRPRILETEPNGYSSPKGSQGSDLKKSIEKLQQLQNSKAGRSSPSYQKQIETSSFAKRRADETSERQYTMSSPGVVHDYTSKIKLAELEKQLKSLQKKYQQAAMDLKASNSKRDMLERGLKEVEGQLKLYKQKHEDSQISSQNLQKRFDYKESSYKEQIKSLTQKLSVSQNGKQQMIFEKNDLVTDFQQREKTLRLSIREKEKQFNEERNRLLKKNEQFSKELAQMQAKTGQNQLKLAEFTRDTTGLSKKNQLLEDRCQSLLAQIDQLRQAHLSEKNKRQELEETLGNNLQLQDDKKKLKKKITEQEQEISKNLKNIALLDSNYQKQVKKTEEVDVSLKEKTNALKNLQKDNDSLAKDIEGLKKNLDEKQKKIQELSAIKQGQSSKVEALSEQVRQIQKKNIEQVKNLKKQIKQKQAKIQSLCKESEDQVQTINDYNSKIENLQIELDGIKSKLSTLQREHEQVQKSKSQLEEEIIQMQVNLSSEKGNKQQIQKALRSEINDREAMIKKLEESIKKFQNNSAHKEEEDAYRISLLEQKINNYENDIKEDLNQIEILKTEIKALQLAKSQGQGNIEQLQFTIKIKNNEIAFLKETGQKNNQQITELSCENKEMSVNIQKLSQKQAEMQIQIESLNGRLNQAHQNGSGVQQQLNSYIKANNEKISSYLNAFLSGTKIQFLPVHQQADIQALMGVVISKVNEVYTNYEESIKKLQGELQTEQSESTQLRLQVEGRLQQCEELRNNLQEALARNHESNQSSDNLIKDLKNQLQSLHTQASNLQSELANLKEVNTSLSEQLDTINSELESKSDENSTLRQHLEQLQEQVRLQERQFSMTQSRQSSKFEEESSSLKTIIASLQDQSRIQSNKSLELDSKLNEKTKQYKQLERKTTEQIKKLSSENDKLNGQVAKQAKQLEAKGNLNSRYSQIESELRSKLEQAGKENAALKELNETVRKRNEKAALKEKQQEDIITGLKSGQSQLNSKQSDLQKNLKERTAEFIASREQNYKLEKEKQKLTQDLEITNALVKVKEDNQKKLEATIKGLQSEKAALQTKIKGLQVSSSEYEKKSAKEISSLNQTKQKYTKQIQQTKLKLESTQQQILGLSKNSQEASKQLGEEIKQLKLKNKGLEDKVALAVKSLADQQKTHSIEGQYLKPVRDNMQLLRGHLAEYARVGDQFESNKNKLLKMATVKVDIPTDKYVGERIRDVSFAYSKLKIFILGCELSETAKNQAGEEIKRVQLALDRVLRGQK